MNKCNKRISLAMLGVFCLVSCISPIIDDTSSSTSIPDDEKLSLYYPFDENDGVLVEEKVSKKKYVVNYLFSNATYKESNDPRRIRGIVGKALEFDGNSTYIEADAFPFPNDDFSLSFYIAPKAYERNDGQYTSIISNLSSIGGIEFAISNYGYYKVIVGTSRGNLQAIITDEPLELYKWSHVALTYDKGKSELKIYINAKLKNTLMLSNGSVLSSDETLIIGKSRYGMEFDGYTANFYNGFIDEIKLYCHCLNTAEVNALASLATSHQFLSNNELWNDYSLLASDRYAPQYHMRHPFGWSNEFYGGFYFNGKYHVFSQHNPFRAFYQHGQRWGHLVSDDLVRYKALYPALVTENNNIDNSQCFSGSAILDNDGNPMLFYTGVNEKQQYLNNISYAVPSDLNDPDLVTWTKANQKIVEQGSFGSYGEFRDPFIYQENGQTFMIIGGDNGSNGACFTYKANDDTLTSWSPLGICYSGSTNQYPVLGTTYELPCLFKLYNPNRNIAKHMLMISPIRAYNGVYYWLGNFNLATGQFTPDNTEPRRIDLGPTNMTLAAFGFVDTNKDRVLLTTMTRTRMSHEDAYLSGWNIGQTLWKELSLNEGGSEIRIKPIAEYALLEVENMLEMNNVSLSVAQVDSLFSQFHLDQCKVEIEIEPNGDKEVGVSVKSGPRGEKVTFSYNYDSKRFYCDNSRSSLDMKNNGSGGGEVDIKGSNLKLTIYVDRSMVEGYIDNINQITVFGFNTDQNSDSFKMVSDLGNAIVKKIKITKLSDAYNQNTNAYWG